MRKAAAGAGAMLGSDSGYSSDDPAAGAFLGGGSDSYSPPPVATMPSVGLPKPRSASIGLLPGVGSKPAAKAAAKRPAFGVVGVSEIVTRVDEENKGTRVLTPGGPQIGPKATTAKAKKDKEPLTSLLNPEDPGYIQIHSHFIEQHPSTTEVESIINIESDASEWEAYREAMAEKRPGLAENDFLVRRVYHGTYVRCNLGLGGNITPCVHEDCRLCQIVRNGFSLEKYGTGRRHPDLEGAPGPCRYGRGLYFCTQAVKAQEYSTCFPCQLGKRGRSAVIACMVVAGRCQPVWETNTLMEGPAEGYDSVLGEQRGPPPTGLVVVQPPRSPELVVPKAAAVLPAQIIVYKHGNTMCPNCGLQVDTPDAARTRVVTQFGTYCSDVCQETFVEHLQEAERALTVTPHDTVEDPSKYPIWSQLKPNDEDKEYHLVGLYPASQEAGVIQSKLVKTLPRATIDKIYRVQNTPLFEAYCKELEATGERMEGEVKEALLFHGVAADPQTIYENGFKDSKTRGMWGTGVYFCSNAAFAQNTGYTDNNGFKSLLLCKVNLGDSADIEPDSMLTKPPARNSGSGSGSGEASESEESSSEAPKRKGKKSAKKGKSKATDRYESVTGITKGNRVHVVYDHRKAYPAYVVIYH